MVTVIIGREFAVTALRSVFYARGVSLAASPLGKAKMMAQVVAILALILGDRHWQGFLTIGHAALWVVVVTALVSAGDYFRRFNPFMSPRIIDITAAREGRARRKVG